MGILDKLRAKLAKPAPTPLTVPEPPVQTPVERRTRERLNAREGTRALVIDDSPTVVAALTKILRSAGYVTLEAQDAETGIETAQREKPDLIFLDIVLPGMNGFSALRLLRRDGITRDIPIIMISGNEQATEQFFGSRIGADDFMKKPFSRLEVFARIERLLDANRHPRRVFSRLSGETAGAAASGAIASAVGVQSAASVSPDGSAAAASSSSAASSQGNSSASTSSAGGSASASSSPAADAYPQFATTTFTTPFFRGDLDDFDNGPDTLPLNDLPAPPKKPD